MFSFLLVKYNKEMVTYAKNEDLILLNFTEMPMLKLSHIALLVGSKIGGPIC